MCPLGARNTRKQRLTAFSDRSKGKFPFSLCCQKGLRGRAGQSGSLKEPERETHTHRVRSSTGGRRGRKETRKHKQEDEGGRWEKSVKVPSNGFTGQSPQLLCMACPQLRSPSRVMSLPTARSFGKRQRTTASLWTSISTKQSFKKETKSGANSDAYARSFLILL